MSGAPRKTYREMLLDPRWQKKRLEILEKHEWSCDSCQSTEKTLHVHHKVYWPGCAPWEYGSGWLAVLCSECHEAETVGAAEDRSCAQAEGTEPEFHKRVFALLPVFDEPGRTEDLLLDLSCLQWASSEREAGRELDLALLAHALGEQETPRVLRRALDGWVADRTDRGVSHEPFWSHLKRVLSTWPDPDVPASAPPENGG